MIHGGDIYRNKIQMDFSVNTNPLGIPKTVQEALEEAVKQCEYYPDIHAEKLIISLSEHTGFAPEQIVCGNGASELFPAIIHALSPKRILIPVPSFYGYEKAARASGARIDYYQMDEKNGFKLEDSFLATLEQDIDLIFLASPNNPVGNTLDLFFLKRMCDRGLELGINVVIDECFIEFTEQLGISDPKLLEQYPNLIVVRAFTKIYAIPGVRLGYLFCSDMELNDKIRTQLPEWNLSTFAQMAGIAALQESEYINHTRAYVKEQRDYLISELVRLGFKVWPSTANFIMFQSDVELFERLLEQQILIRDCKNYRGLRHGFYRAAVKSRKENEELIRKIGEILGAD